jgi:transcriptional regulator with XRE-family HTH domain
MAPDEIKHARKVLGLTQAQMAMVMGYADKTRISHIEAGREKISRQAELLLRAYLDGYRPDGWPSK